MRVVVASLAVVVCFVSCSALHVESARAADPLPGEDVAKRLFVEGQDLEKKGDWTGALARFQQAAQIKSSPGLRFHQAYATEMSGQLAAALDAYEAADRAAEAENRADVREMVRTRYDALKARVPSLALHITTPAAGAQVTLDSKPVAEALLSGTAFRVDPGEHTVAARVPGHASFGKVVRVPASNATTTVDIVFEKLEPRAPLPSDTMTPPREEQKRSIVLPLVATVGAVVLVGGGVGAFVVASSKQHDAEKACKALTSCEDKRGPVRTFDALALGGFIGGAALGAFAVVLWARSGKPADARATVHLGPGTASFEGTF